VSDLAQRLRATIRQDVHSMHAYAVQPSAGLVKLDTMENPFRLPEALAQLGLQLGRQPKRVLHGIELDHAGRVLDRVGVHGLHVLTDPLQESGIEPAHLVFRIGGTVFKRISAARAWACKPSP
jgi:hypothetical protein